MIWVINALASDNVLSYFILGGTTMHNVFDYAKYFIKKGMDSSPNTFDGNMKLQKLLLFANLVSLAEREEPLFTDEIYAFKNGCVVESVRKTYRQQYGMLKEESDAYVSKFTKEEQSILDLTTDIFGKLSARELSNLNHQFDFWKNAYAKGTVVDDYHVKVLSKVQIEDMKAEIGKIKTVIDTFKQNEELQQKYELVNDVFFYYDEDLTINDEILNELEEFSLSAEDSAYSIYLDEGKLVIF